MDGWMDGWDQEQREVGKVGLEQFEKGTTRKKRELFGTPLLLRFVAFFFFF
jgi:hypothetical protein